MDFVGLLLYTLALDLTCTANPAEWKALRRDEGGREEVEWEGRPKKVAAVS